MSVKPSWAVTKLSEALGRRRRRPKRSSLPASRVARSWRVGVAPRHVSRTVLRNRSFHSAHGAGNPPRW